MFAASERVRVRVTARVPHEVMKANIIISHLLDYCPGNTPQVSTWSRTNPLSG